MEEKIKLLTCRSNGWENERWKLALKQFIIGGLEIMSEWREAIFYW